MNKGHHRRTSIGPHLGKAEYDSLYLLHQSPL